MTKIDLKLPDRQIWNFAWSSKCNNSLWPWQCDQYWILCKHCKFWEVSGPCSDPHWCCTKGLLLHLARHCGGGLKSLSPPCQTHTHTHTRANTHTHTHTCARAHARTHTHRHNQYVAHCACTKCKHTCPTIYPRYHLPSFLCRLLFLHLSSQSIHCWPPFTLNVLHVSFNQWK